MRRRIASGLLAVCVLLELLPVSALAEEANPGAGFTQTENFAEEGNTLFREAGEGADHTEIDYQQLYATISVANGVEITGFRTEYLNTLPKDADELQRIPIVIPEQIHGSPVVSIGNQAFHAAKINTLPIRITEIDLSQAEALEKIGDFAFYDQGGGGQYSQLKGTLVIPNKVKTIGSHAFRYLSGLSGDLILPDSLEAIGSSAFADCGFDGKLKLPRNSNYKTVEEQLVQNTHIKELDGGIPENITTLGKSAFRDTELAGDMVLPDTVTTFDSAFNGTKITSLVIPATVTKMPSKYWIDNCKELQFVKFDAVSVLDDPASAAFPMTHNSGGYHNNLTIIFPTQEACNKAIAKETNTTYQNYCTYEAEVTFFGLNEKRTLLYRRPLNWAKEPGNWTWSADRDYQLPEVPNQNEGRLYGWSFRVDGTTVNDIVTEASNMAGTVLYPIAYVPLPTVSTSGDISKTYDGKPSAFTITVEHPYLESKKYTAYYNWRLVELEGWRVKAENPINGCKKLTSALKDKNNCVFQDVADSVFYTNEGTRSFYEVRWYLFEGGSQVTGKGFSGSATFTVTITKAQPAITPVYPALVRTDTPWSAVTLSAGESAPAGTIAWTDASGNVSLGENRKEWTFTPADTENYETVTGTATVTGAVDSTVRAAISGTGGAISPESQVVEVNSDATFTVIRDPGYRVDSILVNGENRLDYLKDGKLTLPEVREDTEITVSFARMTAEDVKDKLPPVEEGTPVEKEEDKKTILDSKIDYEELKNSQELSPEAEEEAANQLSLALAALPEVSIEMESAGGAAKPELLNGHHLLENMTGDEAAQMKKQEISKYKILVTDTEAQPDGSLESSISAALNGAERAAHRDVQVKKIVTRNDGETTEQLTELQRPIELAFAVPQDLPPVSAGKTRSFLILRTHGTADGGYSTEKLPGKLSSDGRAYLVKSDRFSVYTLAYTDVANGGSSGGSDAPSYPITIPDGIKHGKLTVSDYSASAGNTVTVSAHPDSGYRLCRVTASGDAGEPVQLTELGNGEFAFSMPEFGVTVTAVFVPLEGGWMPFTDVKPGDWFYEAAEYVYCSGLMLGTTASTFSPGSPATRGMIVTILHRAEGSPAASAGEFEDVKEGEYYAQAISWAAEHGIVFGYEGGRFCPDEPITREELAAVLYRYAGYKGMKTEAAEGALAKFADASTASGYAETALNWAVSNGLLLGVDRGMLDPQGKAVRAQAAAVLMRFRESLNG